MNTPRLSNLLFLSGFAALAMPGCDSDSDDTETTASNATDGGTDGTTDPSGTTGGTTGPDGTMDTSGTVSGTVTATGEPTTTTAGGKGVCPALATTAAECVPEYNYEEELNYCVELLAAFAEYGADCATAYEEALACASALNCADFNAKDSTACQAELDAAEEACGFGGSTGGSSGGSDTDGGSGTDG